MLASSGEVAIADLGNSCIQIFDRQGNFQRKFGSYGTEEDGQFRLVHSLASALEQVGREREARRLFARAYELDPDSDTIAEDYERTH